MSAAPMFARYIRPGDTITHPHGFRGIVKEVHWYDPKTPNRAHGVVSGWMTNDKPGQVQGFSYPAENLIIVHR